jgi:drug/metabolite transporter (DMT)-like permease
MDSHLQPKWLSLLIGPELLWVLIYVAVTLLAKANNPPGARVDNLIENLAFLIPALAALIFMLWYVPDVEKRWLLLRVWVAGLFGAHLAMEKGMLAYSEQGPGIGTAYIMGMALVIFVLVVGSVFVLIRFRSQS